METYWRRLVTKYDTSDKYIEFSDDLVVKKVFESPWLDRCVTKVRKSLQPDRYINGKKRIFCNDCFIFIRMQIHEDGTLSKNQQLEKIERINDISKNYLYYRSGSWGLFNRSICSEILNFIEEYFVPLLSRFKKSTEDLDECDLSLSETWDLEKEYRHRPFCARCGAAIFISCPTCTDIGYCGLICMIKDRSEHSSVCGKIKHD